MGPLHGAKKIVRYALNFMMPVKTTERTIEIETGSETAYYLDIYSRKRDRLLSKQLIVFTTMGGIATVVHYLLLTVLVEVLHVAPVPASIAGYVAGAVTNYLLNYYITFRSYQRHYQALAKFALVATLGLGLNTAIMAIGTGWLALHYILSQMLATGLTLVWNFTANRLWTF